MSGGALFERLNVFSAGEHDYWCYRIPALAVTAKGTVLAFCEARKNGCADWAVTDIVMRRSTNGGTTWGEQYLIAGDGINTTNQPCPVVDRHTGTIWFLFCKNNQQVFAIQSVDDGLTWSQPIEITPQVKAPAWHYVAVGPGHGIQLNSGRLVVPAWGDVSPGPVTWSPAPNWGVVQFSCVFYSDDHGTTWKCGGVLEADASDECEIVETTDNAMYMNMRSRHQKFCRAYAWSTDGGETWSSVQYDQRLPEPSCQASIIRLTDKARFGKDRVLLAHPASTTERARLTARVSYDECRTWPVAKVVEPGSAGYSDLAVTPDLTILCLYEAEHRFDGGNPFENGWGDWKDADRRKLEADPNYFSDISRESKLTLARFNIDWLTDGGDNERPRSGDDWP